MIEEPTTVVFSLVCDEARAWVCFSGRDRRAHVLEMWQPGPGTWSACVALPWGDYSCRCYAGDGRMVTYWGPATVDGGVVDGMDAVFTVRRSTAALPAAGRQDDASGTRSPRTIPNVDPVALFDCVAEV